MLPYNEQNVFVFKKGEKKKKKVNFYLRDNHFSARSVLCRVVSSSGKIQFIDQAGFAFSFQSMALVVGLIITCFLSSSFMFFGFLFYWNPTCPFRIYIQVTWYLCKYVFVWLYFFLVTWVIGWIFSEKWVRRYFKNRAVIFFFFSILLLGCAKLILGCWTIGNVNSVELGTLLWP